MKGTTILLLGAVTLVAYASAHPYSKIPDAFTASDGYQYKKSSSNSNSNSYSQSNQDEADINGAFGGQSFSGSKSSGYSTGGGSHSQSSSFSSGAFKGQVPLNIFGEQAAIAGIPDVPSVAYGQPNFGVGNPGTAGLGLSDNGSGAVSGSFSSSYGNSNVGGSAGSSKDQEIEGAQGADSSGSYTGAGIGSVSGTGSGLNTGIKGGSSGSSSGNYGSVGGASFGQAGLPISGSYGTPGSNYVGQVGSQPGSVQYWWNGPKSPFGLTGKPSGGCTSNACSLFGSFDLSKGSAGGAHASNQGGQVGLNVYGGNPFLSEGQAGSGSGYISSDASFGQSGIGSGSGFVSGSGSDSVSGSGSSSQPIDGSKNPFLSGGYSGSSAGTGLVAGSGSYGSSISGSGAASSGSGSHGSSSSSESLSGAGNPFLKPGSGSGQIPHGSGQLPTPVPGYTAFQGSGFVNTGSGSGQIPHGSGQLPTPVPGYTTFQGSGFVNTGSGSVNPFFKPGSGSVVVTPPVPILPSQSNQGFPAFPSPLPSSDPLIPQQHIGGISSSRPSSVSGASGSSGSYGSAGSGDFQGQSGQDSSYFSQSTIGAGSSSAGYPTTSTLIPQPKPYEANGGLTVSCSGQGRICVLKNLCTNGRVNSNEQGLFQVRTGNQLCKVDREVCCTLNEYSGSSTNFGSSQGTSFGSSGSSSSSHSGSGGNYGSLVGSSGKPTVPAPTVSYGQTTGSTGNYGQSGQFGSSGSHGQAGNFDSSENYDGPGSHGSSGSFGQTGQSGLAGSHDQTQQKESFNFDAQSNVQTTFGQQGGSGFTQGFPAGSSSGTPASNLIHVTPGTVFGKPTSGSYGGGNSGFPSVNSNAYAGASSQAGSGISGSLIHTSPTPSSQGTFTSVKKPNKQEGGLFGSSDNSGEDLSSSDVSNTGSFGGIKGSFASNGYLPPFGSEPSSDVPAFVNPPEIDGGPSDTNTVVKRPPPRPTTFVPAPIVVQVGCAAALICVEERFCTLEGVISPEPVALTSQQIERRAPLSSCKNPDNGVIGKCCRDPNYVDPWPTGNLPANYSGGFDEQGFPTYLNIAKTKPPTKPVIIKTSFNQATKDFGITPKPTEKGWLQDAFTNFTQNFNIPTSFPEVQLPTFTFPWDTKPSGTAETSDSDSSVSSVPSDDGQVAENPSGTSSRPPLFGFIPPNFPNFFPNQNTIKTYEPSSTNENPIVIAPHTPGAQCGLRNKVQRPSGLDIDDVAFGEIPWQAMVLSTTDRKLLCSGAIVAPNAVLTAAHCVTGLRPEEVSIKSGEWKLGYELKHEEPLPFEIVTVANIVPHPGFQPNSPSHDLAILFLEHPVTLDQHVDVLCLGDIPQPKLGRKCISTGWGKIVLQVNVAGSLMHSIDVDVVPQDECRRRLQGAESQIPIDNTLTCVKPQKQRNNICQVDVGGPLACDRGDGYYELTGIYSQDTGCQPTNQVATFALIDTNWVKKTLAYPPQVPNPSFEFLVPNDKSPSPSDIHSHFGNEVIQPPAKCDCQKSVLPPDLNKYLPPV